MTVKTMELFTFFISLLDAVLQSTTCFQAHRKAIGMKFPGCTKQQAVQILHPLLSHWECTKQKAERAGTPTGGNSPQHMLCLQ